MIEHLHIRNYALIEELEISFSDGFSTITGETGAGKSILLGALSLILGQRADTTVLKQLDEKCSVEGTFRLGQAFRTFFEENDLDFQPVTIMRREITPNGKSRAFINDTPVNLNQMKELGTQLVDIHSQHQNLRLNDHVYQMEVVDFVGRLGSELAEYRSIYGEYRVKSAELETFRASLESARKELEFLEFQFTELKDARLREGEMEELEEEAEVLGHAGEISQALGESAATLNGDETGTVRQLKDTHIRLQKILAYYHPARALAERLEAAMIDIKDAATEMELLAGKVEFSPERQEIVRQRIDLLYRLLQKHRLKTVEELIALRDELDRRISDITLSDEKTARLEKEIAGLLSGMGSLAASMHKKRTEAGKTVEKEVAALLRQLGIPNARFEVRVDHTGIFDPYGSDQVRFLFSANKQSELEEIGNVASGGEISRLMLSLKSLLSDFTGLPTLILDEIDTGVSGEIADKVGQIMQRMAGGRQLIAITHLPQVAAKGADHYLVFKEDSDNATHTRIRKLSGEERVVEIAKMVSGEKITDAALSNARELLKIKQN
ncbi:MAG: DNA repair protein RecN [Bacteroidota bacterium]